MKKIIVLYIFLLFVPTINTYIIESDSIEVLFEHIDTTDTFVIFDLDNTLIHPYQELGSDEWFSYLLQEKMNEGYTSDAAHIAVLPYSYYVQHYIEMQPIEPVMPLMLQDLRNKNINTMALTARGPFLSERTYEQLKTIDIHFYLNFSCIKEHVMLLHFPCLYRYSMLFVGSNNKGEALRHFLEICNYHPKKIIYIDDKIHHLHSVEKALSDWSEICCIRYSRCDDYVASFDIEKAQEQFALLREREQYHPHSTVTDLAKLRGLSIEHPR